VHGSDRGQRQRNERGSRGWWTHRSELAAPGLGEPTLQARHSFLQALPSNDKSEGFPFQHDARPPEKSLMSLHTYCEQIS
jgi:hypothetical protein